MTLAEFIVTQKVLARFFENSPSFATAVFGKPENTKVRLYEVGGGELKIMRADFTGLRMIERDSSEFTEVQLERPDIEIESTRKWDRNYNALANDLLENKAEYTHILINTTEDFTDDRRSFLVATTYVIAFYKYHSRKNKKNSS